MFKLKEETKLEPHQKEFLGWFRVRRTVGLFDVPGLGKSLEILSAICDNLKTGEKALVVVPPHLVPNWMNEISMFTYLEVGKDIDIVPYTQLGKKVDTFEGYDFISADEAHYLKNMDAKRTFSFMTMLDQQKPRFFIYATGTPLNNRIPEIYNFLLMLAGWNHVTPKVDVLYPTYYQFCERFCHVKATSYGSGVKYHGMKRENLPELREYLANWTIRRKKSEDSLGMTDTKVIAKYSEDLALSLAWEEHASNGTVGGIDIVAKKNSAIAKAPFTAKWVQDELESGTVPIVIFSDHVFPAIYIHDQLAKNGWVVGLIKGGDDLNKRANLVERFQKGLVDVLVSTSAGYEGITLTKSNIIVVNDIPWVPAKLEQLRFRIDRMTQTRPCRCIYIIGSRADDQISQTIRAKMKVINAVIEGETK